MGPGPSLGVSAAFNFLFGQYSNTGPGRGVEPLFKALWPPGEGRALDCQSWRDQDSNLGPPAYEAGGLPTALPRYRYLHYTSPTATSTIGCLGCCYEFPTPRLAVEGWLVQGRKPFGVVPASQSNTVALLDSSPGKLETPGTRRCSVRFSSSSRASFMNPTARSRLGSDSIITAKMHDAALNGYNSVPWTFPLGCGCGLGSPERPERIELPFGEPG